MSKVITPTNPTQEADNGRIALWLDAKDLEWLASYCACTDATPDLIREHCARIRFRANAALHKAGQKPTGGKEA